MNNENIDTYFERAEHLDCEAECWTPKDGVTCVLTETGETLDYVAFYEDEPNTPYFHTNDNDVLADTWTDVWVSYNSNRPQVVDNGCCG